MNSTNNSQHGNEHPFNRYVVINDSLPWIVENKQVELIIQNKSVNFPDNRELINFSISPSQVTPPPL
jgi:hypothetical protein